MLRIFSGGGHARGALLTGTWLPGLDDGRNPGIVVSSQVLKYLVVIALCYKGQVELQSTANGKFVTIDTGWPGVSVRPMLTQLSLVCIHPRKWSCTVGYQSFQSS